MRIPTYSPEQMWIMGLLGALGVVVVVALARLRGWIRQVPAHVALGVGAATLVALLLPLFATAPAFVHISLHGPLLLESILAFPSPDVHRREFGQGSYVVLGLAAAAFGRSAETVMAANACLSAATTPLVGFVAARWAGRDSAALYASAAWATSPFVARLAHSEDSHVSAVLFAVMALAWAEVASARGSQLALTGAVLSVVLAMWTRQTTYLMAILVIAVLLERRRAAVRASHRVLALGPFVFALVAILSSLALRVASTLGESGDAMILPVLLVMARHPGVAFAALLRHPFFSPVRLSILVPTLGLMGAVYLGRRGPVRLSFVSYMAVMTFMTLPASFRSVGVAWSFRLPLYALALVAVGVGGAVVENAVESRRPGSSSSARRLAAAALCGVVGLVAGGTLENRAANPEFVEYTFIRDTLSREPRPFTLAAVHLEEPSAELPARVARRLGVPVALMGEGEAKDPSGPWIFFETLACHGHSIPKLFEQTLGGAAGEAAIERFLLAAFDPRQGFGIGLAPRPVGMRAACAAVAARAGTRSVEGPDVAVEDDPPMVMYDSGAVRLRILSGP
jgi:hypothetical protein